MGFLIIILIIIEKILNNLGNFLLYIFIFLSNFTKYFTGESKKIILVDKSLKSKLIYICWGFVGFIFIMFFIFIAYDFYIIQTLSFVKIELLFKILFVLIPTIIIYNIYFLALKTLHLPINFFSVIPVTIVKILLVSLFLFFLTFPIVYKINCVSIEKKTEIFKKNEMIKNEHLTKYNPSVKKEIGENISKNNYLYRKALLIYRQNNFKICLVLIVCFFNFSFFLKITLMILDENYVSQIHNEDYIVKNNDNFN
jgi:hypothetical protein